MADNGWDEMNSHLTKFPDEELMEIVTKPDEWNKADYPLALEILKDRGKEINPELAESIKKQRIEELAKPEPSQKNWIIAGYCFAILGGLLGIFIGWHLSSFQKSLPNGGKVYAYSDSDRKNGKRILIIGIICCSIALVLKIVAMADN